MEGPELRQRVDVMQVIDVLNNMFSSFDMLCQKHGVYKVARPSLLPASHVLKASLSCLSMTPPPPKKKGGGGGGFSTSSSPSKHTVSLLACSFNDQSSRSRREAQVETIGDAYMAVAGHDGRPGNHAQRITEMALGMIEASKNIPNPDPGPGSCTALARPTLEEKKKEKKRPHSCARRCLGWCVCVCERAWRRAMLTLLCAFAVCCCVRQDLGLRALPSGLASTRGQSVRALSGG